MAKVEVLDVGHGVCVSLEDDEGRLWLFDCGHEESRRPSFKFADRAIDRLVISNYDEDHISDLPGLFECCDMSRCVLFRNKTITAEQLRGLKQNTGYVTKAMEQMLTMFADFSAPVAPGVSQGGGSVAIRQFRHWFFPVNLPESGFFCGTNNISLVTFLHVHGLHMLLPGDLEKAGWLAHLRDPAFCAELARVNVLVASHHGRENGYCEEIFKYCRPELVVISDAPKRFDTQEMTGDYGRQASGCRIHGEDRLVLTTRADETITFETTPYGLSVYTAAGMRRQAVQEAVRMRTLQALANYPNFPFGTR